MPQSVQPDLFGDYDRAEEAAERMGRPATCPACGTEEHSGYMLRQNHGAEPGEPGICGFPPGEHPVYGAECLAQHLVRNHITYAARHDQADMLAERMDRGPHAWARRRGDRRRRPLRLPRQNPLTD